MDFFGDALYGDGPFGGVATAEPGDPAGGPGTGGTPPPTVPAVTPSSGFGAGPFGDGPFGGVESGPGTPTVPPDVAVPQFPAPPPLYEKPPLSMFAGANWIRF